MGLEVFNDIEQGTEEWLQLRCGVPTASVIGNIITERQPTAIEATCLDCGAARFEPCVGKRSPGPLKTLHPARAATAKAMAKQVTVDHTSETARGLALTLAAERITGHVEPIIPSRDMERGTLDEPYAREVYSSHYAAVTETGFMVRDDLGFRVGYSPDGLVSSDGLIEVKSRKQKIHLKTILADAVPAENMAQIQTGLWVSGRAWCDYISYCGGMPLYVKRVFPIPGWHEAIVAAVSALEASISKIVQDFEARTAGLPPTERIDHFPELELKF